MFSIGQYALTAFKNMHSLYQLHGSGDGGCVVLVYESTGLSGKKNAMNTRMTLLMCREGTILVNTGGMGLK